MNEYLKGQVDYYIAARRNLLVVEAKLDNLVSGFTQLAVEMIALDRWTRDKSPIIFGAVTDGDRWLFGCFDRAAKLITQDTQIYQVSISLESLLRVLIGILS